VYLLTSSAGVLMRPASWYVVTANAPWPARYGHQMVSADDRTLVLTGGTDFSQTTYLRDVWNGTFSYLPSHCANGKIDFYEDGVDCGAYCILPTVKRILPHQAD
jgi:hypothetical protein